MKTDKFVKEEKTSEFCLGWVEWSAKALLESALHPPGKTLTGESGAQLPVDAGGRQPACESAGKSGEDEGSQNQSRGRNGFHRHFREYECVQKR